MRIIDPFYIVTSTIIIGGLSALLYMKIYLKESKPFYITIYGSKISSFLLAYQLSQMEIPDLEISLIGNFDSELIDLSGDPGEDESIRINSFRSAHIDRKVIQFCGNEPLFMQMLEDTHLQYKIKRSQIFFAGGTVSCSAEKDFESSIYHIDNEKNTFQTILNFGLSHLTATSFFNDFQKHLKTGVDHSQINQKSLRGVLNSIMPGQIKPAVNGLQYLSQNVGLDQRYIRDYINPIISSSYMNNVNSIATIFKMLPLYCNIPDSKGKTKNLALLLDEKYLTAKLLIRLKEKKVNRISLQKVAVMDLQEQENHNVTMKLLIEDGQMITRQTNLFVTLEDFEEDDQKQVSYYRTIVDGLISRDDKFEQVYSINFQKGLIMSVTRLCANDCKDFRYHVYLVVSKKKLQQKNLVMFTHHQIMQYRKMSTVHTNLPSSAVKFQQTPHIYRVPDTDLVADNYEMKLIAIRSVANMINEQVRTSRNFE